MHMNKLKITKINKILCSSYNKKNKNTTYLIEFNLHQIDEHIVCIKIIDLLELNIKIKI